MNDPRPPNARIGRWRRLIPAVLFAWGLGLNLAYAGKGFIPIDQSIIFDGGWRIFSGQVPFRDFSTLTGLFPMYLQAGFFAAFGVSWFVYCLHAAIFNGLYCVLSYALLRKLGGGFVLSAAYSLLSGLSFYPIPGTPYLEHHAFFFLILAIWMLVSSRDASPARMQLYLLAAPLSLTLSFLSKQHVPVLFGIAVLAAAVYGIRGPASRTKVKWLLLGCAALLLALVVGSLVIGVDAGRVWADFIQQTRETGARRLSRLAERAPDLLLRELEFTLPKSGIIFVILSGLYLAAGRRNAVRAGIAPMLQWGLSAGLVAGALAFSLLTRNQGIGSYANMFVALGIVHSLVLTVERRSPTPRWTAVRRSCLAIFVLLCAAQTYAFYLHVSSRSYLDITFSSEAAEPLRTEGLQFLRFQTAELLSRYTAESLDGVAGFLKENSGNFFLLGDSSILYGITGRPSVNPHVYFHSQMGRRSFQGSRRAEYEQRLFDNLRKYNVRYIVLEGNRTWTRVRLNTLPRLQALVETEGAEAGSFGIFRVIELPSRTWR